MANNLTLPVFEVHANFNQDFVTNPFHAKFCIHDEIEEVLPDPWGDPSQPRNREPRSPVKTPVLRIYPQHMPKNPEDGWVFGSDRDSCDILLDEGHARGVSSKQFAIQIEQDILFIKNISKHGTRIKFSVEESMYIRMVSERVLGDWAEISFGFLTLRLRVPNPSSHDEEPGLPYYYEEELGRGSGGCVYRAIHKVTGDVCVVKRYFHHDLAVDEVSALLKIKHENIVKLHAYYTEPKPELFMEYISGNNLRSEQQLQPLNLHEFKMAMSQMLDALSHIHEQNITHRDLKPENIIVQSRKPLHVKIIDFNVSSRKVFMNDFAGTSCYIAPEITAGEFYTNKADIWSLGIMALEMLGSIRPTDTKSAPLLVREFSLRWQKHPDAVDFISSLLHEDQYKRPYAPEAHKHKFLEICKSDDTISLPLTSESWGFSSRFPRFQEVGTFTGDSLYSAQTSVSCKDAHASIQEPPTSSVLSSIESPSTRIPPPTIIEPAPGNEDDAGADSPEASPNSPYHKESRSSSDQNNKGDSLHNRPISSPKETAQISTFEYTSPVSSILASQSVYSQVISPHHIALLKAVFVVLPNPTRKQYLELAKQVSSTAEYVKPPPQRATKGKGKRHGSRVPSGSAVSQQDDSNEPLPNPGQSSRPGPSERELRAMRRAQQKARAQL
ncbi:Serine/threonine-protein kinase pakG [Cladobotryum mycophilum]|uniref:Autophagy-related protein 1 n=1 Tax=Cladobotryum mycophilum TaxID=491253 RepID=A0ABR0SNX1_9HYPO